MIKLRFFINNHDNNKTLILKTICISIIKNYPVIKNSLFKNIKISRVSYIFSYTIVQFCPKVGESLSASGQPILRQRKVNILPSVSLVSFSTILKAYVKVTRC